MILAWITASIGFIIGIVVGHIAGSASTHRYLRRIKEQDIELEYLGSLIRDSKDAN